METWQSILLAIGGNTALLAVLTYVAKSLFEKVLTRDTKKFESDLKAKSDAEIERLKNQLQIRSIEHQVRFSRLHERRAETIAKLYGLLVEALWAAEIFLSPIGWVGEPSIKEKHTSAMNKLVDAFRYFDQHKIYFDEDLCESLEKLLRETRRLVIEFGVWVGFDDASLSNDSVKQKQEAWLKNWQAIRNDIPEARRQLENKFRSILGSLPETVKSQHVQ